MLSIFITTASMMLLSYIIPGISVSTAWAALGFAIWLAIFNATIGRLLKFIGCAINFLSLGLFNLIINTWMIRLADRMIDGIEIKSFFTAMLLGIALSLIATYFSNKEAHEN